MAVTTYPIKWSNLREMFKRAAGHLSDVDDRATELEAQKWDDLRVAITSGTTGNLSPPDLKTFRNGLLAKAFAANGVEQVYFDVQLPHGWVEGSGIRPHIHWSPGNSTNKGVVRWALEYSWANAVAPPGNTFPASTTLITNQAATGTPYSHQIAQWSEIDGTDKRLSSVLMCRLARFGAQAGDTFTGDAFALSVDFHILTDSRGSTEEFPGA